MDRDLKSLAASGTLVIFVPTNDGVFFACEDLLGVGARGHFRNVRKVYAKLANPSLVFAVTNDTDHVLMTDELLRTADPHGLVLDRLVNGGPDWDAGRAVDRALAEMQTFDFSKGSLGRLARLVKEDFELFVNRQPFVEMNFGQFHVVIAGCLQGSMKWHKFIINTPAGTNRSSIFHFSSVTYSSDEEPSYQATGFATDLKDFLGREANLPIWNAMLGKPSITDISKEEALRAVEEVFTACAVHTAQREPDQQLGADFSAAVVKDHHLYWIREIVGEPIFVPSPTR